MQDRLTFPAENGKKQRFLRQKSANQGPLLRIKKNLKKTLEFSSIFMVL
jgi:hypothetical protein